MALAAAYSLYCSHFGCDNVALGISISVAAIEVQINSVIKGGGGGSAERNQKHEETDLGGGGGGGGEEGRRKAREGTQW